MLRFAAATAGMLACALLTGCDPATDDRSVVWLNSPEAITKLNTPAGMFQQPTRGVWVDPRSAKAYAESHIPGAINVPLPDMDDAASAELADYNLFIVYDRDYTDVMATAGAKRLIELGFKNVYALTGGLSAWQKDGNAVQQGTKPQ